MIYYKVLNTNGTPYHGGNGVWNLPHEGPGKWMPPIHPVVPCVSGYHVTTLEHLITWIGPAVFEAEISGTIIEVDTKVVASCARLLRRLPWDDRKARLFAADCAEHVSHFWTERYPKDTRIADCIATVRRYVGGKASLDDLIAVGVAAANAGADAAFAAVADAAAAASYAAYRAAVAAAADAADAANDAASYAASYAADAAGLADAADAASYAADAAADAASYAAADAANDAASYAASYAADAAAADAANEGFNAERQWQTERLAFYLEQEA